MSLNCPNCGAELGLNLAVLSLNGGLAATPNPPQSAPTATSNGAANVPQVASNGHVGGESLSSKTSTKRQRFNYPDPDFALFWKAYPRRVGKASAYAKWLIARREVEAQTLIAAASKFAARVEAQNTEERFIPYPEGWLNAGRWEDEDTAVKVDARYKPYDHEAHLRELEEIKP